MKENNFVSAVVYIRNKKDAILQTLEVITNIFVANFKKWEIVCVEDCSSDGSFEAVRDFAQKYNGNSAISMLQFL
jgi:dolichol-phosphate mannosyltransferase